MLFKKKKKRLDSLLTAREEGENVKPYYSFVALSSKNLSANKQFDGQTDGRTDGNSKICIPIRFVRLIKFSEVKSHCQIYQLVLGEIHFLYLHIPYSQTWTEYKNFQTRKYAYAFNSKQVLLIIGYAQINVIFRDAGESWLLFSSVPSVLT